MGDIVTMDDLTNQEIVAVLDDAERLVPVARGDVYLPSYRERCWQTCSSKTQLGPECHLRLP